MACASAGVKALNAEANQSAAVIAVDTDHWRPQYFVRSSIVAGRNGSRKPGSSFRDRSEPNNGVNFQRLNLMRERVLGFLYELIEHFLVVGSVSCLGFATHPEVLRRGSYLRYELKARRGGVGSAAAFRRGTRKLLG